MCGRPTGAPAARARVDRGGVELEAELAQRVDHAAARAPRGRRGSASSAARSAGSVWSTQVAEDVHVLVLAVDRRQLGRGHDADAVRGAPPPAPRRRRRPCRGRSARAARRPPRRRARTTSAGSGRRRSGSSATAGRTSARPCGRAACQSRAVGQTAWMARARPGSSLPEEVRPIAIVVIVGAIMSILDTTIVNVALQTLRDGPRRLAGDDPVGLDRLPARARGGDPADRLGGRALRPAARLDDGGRRVRADQRAVRRWRGRPAR